MAIPNDYSDVFAEFGQTITRHRKTGGARVDGVWREGAEVDAPIFAVVQPATPSEIQRNPAGFRDTKVYRVDTEADLRPASADGGGVEPDHVTYLGERYVVARLGDWRPTSGFLTAFVALQSPVTA